MIQSLVRTSCLALVLVFFVPVAAHAQQHSSAPLQERMSYAEFMRLGLNKLSPDQLKALNAWLQEHGDTGPSLEAAPAANGGTGSAAESASQPGELHTHIVGEFHGWESGTVFKFANGRRAEVIGDSEVMVHSIDSPGVTLRKGFLGGWLMDVDGVRETVHVKMLH